MTNQPTTIVIFGATGDLTRRKLIPALFSSYTKGRVPCQLNIVGTSRTDWTHEETRQTFYEGMVEFAPDKLDAHEAEWQTFAQNIYYSQGDSTVDADYERLKTFLDEMEDGATNRIYYLAVAPRFFVPIVKNLGKHGLVEETNGWRRVIVEKPFGIDLASAQELSHDLHTVFDEHQIYRIDHYLGKETAQNLLFFRFANTIFEPIWNRNYVENVQLTVVESVDVQHRAGYYDASGVVRDMIQNHMMQLLTLAAMEPPASFEANAVRNEKAKLLQAIRPIALNNTVRAQYEGYCQAEGVAEQSQTPTFAALKLFIDNWRWQGVPFYLRSGKALKEKRSEIIIEFKRPPHMMFDVDEDEFEPNILSIHIQPDEGMHLKFEAKVPDAIGETRSVDLEFHYKDTFEQNALPDAYERLLLDAINGDPTLFTRDDEIEAAWRLIDPLLNGWAEAESAPSLVQYEKGSWGPHESDALLAQDGHKWRFGWHH